jgi:hypothetical protein
LRKREDYRRSAPAEGVMLEQGDLAFTKAMSKNELSSVLLLDLRKVMVAVKKKEEKKKKKKALAVSKTSATSALALEYNSGVRSEAQTSREIPQPKRKAEEFSSSNCSSETASPPCARASV